MALSSAFLNALALVCVIRRGEALQIAEVQGGACLSGVKAKRVGKGFVELMLFCRSGRQLTVSSALLCYRARSPTRYSQPSLAMAYPPQPLLHAVRASHRSLFHSFRWADLSIDVEDEHTRHAPSSPLCNGGPGR